jgi:hypothetical protein
MTTTHRPPELLQRVLQVRVQGGRPSSSSAVTSAKSSHRRVAREVAAAATP